MPTPNLDWLNNIENTQQPGVAYNQLANDLDAALAGAVIVDFSVDDDLELTRPEWMTGVLVLTDSGPVLTGPASVIFPGPFPNMLVVNSTAQNLVFEIDGFAGTVTVNAGQSARISRGPTGIIKDPASGGGGGAVDSVNGQTGVVVLELDDLDDVDAATPSDGDALTWVAANNAWEPVAGGGGGGMSNPMTTAGDIIIGGSSGTPQRLAAGTNTHILTMVAGAPAWAAPGSGSGDVVGPASATADAVALFDGTTGKLLKNGVTVAEIKRITQNSQSTAYTLVLADAGRHILHPSADTTARTFTIPANSSVAFPIGTAVTFVNQNAAGVVTIAITTDTMRLAGAGTTGSRTLAANGVATAIKITSTEWIISGTGLT